MRVPRPAARTIAVVGMTLRVAGSRASCQRLRDHASCRSETRLACPVPAPCCSTSTAPWSISVPDLAASLARLFAARGLAPLPQAAVAAMVGDGVRVLLARAFAARGGAPDERDLADYMDDYGAHLADATRPYPGAAATLTRLRAAGWRVAVCTNKPEALARGVLAATGLMKLIDAIGGGDSFPVRKPDPEHLRATLARAGGDAAQAVMVGGSPQRHRRGPRRRRDGDLRRLGLWPAGHGRGCGRDRAGFRRPGGDRGAAAAVAPAISRTGTPTAPCRPVARHRHAARHPRRPPRPRPSAGSGAPPPDGRRARTARLPTRAAGRRARSGSGAVAAATSQSSKAARLGIARPLNSSRRLW